jgi:Domain of unknown function (DUF4352)
MRASRLRGLLALLSLSLLVACDSETPIAAPPSQSPPETSPASAASFEFELLQWRCRHADARSAEEVIRADGEFCFAALDVTNVGSAGGTLDASCQFMIDGEQRYTPHLDVMALDEASVAAFGEEIAPGALVENTAVYYDVPKRSYPDALELHEACGDPGIRLPLDPELRSDRIGGDQG